MSAYAILDAVQNARITAPTTVYRALSRLIADGAVHRLESLNAYVACSDLPHLHGSSVFAICRDCGHVDELAEVASIYFQLAPHGGIRPAVRRRSRLALTLSEREEISRGIAAARPAPRRGGPRGR